ncbi:sulfatase [bacterium]|nr:sulfatase [bacterium]
MKRRHLQSILCICGSIYLILAHLGCQTKQGPIESSTTPPQNIFLLSLDTLRADHLSCYGYPRQTSPCIDYLAKQAVQFHDAFSQDSSTAPSHMTLFTSLFPSSHGVSKQNCLNQAIPTMAVFLKARHYATLGFTGGGNLSTSFGFDRGFDTYVCQDILGTPGDTTYLDERVLPAIMEKQANHSPFFCFLHTYCIHDPYVPPPPFHNMFSHDIRNESIERIRAIEQFWDMDLLQQRRHFWNIIDTSDPEHINFLRALYDGEIRYTDSILQKIFRRCGQMNGKTGTLTIIVSDHGEEFLDHRGYFHANKLYDELVHVPFILHWPDRFTSGSIRSDRVGLIDILPTVLGIVGGRSPNHFQGRDLLGSAHHEIGTDRPIFMDNMRRSLLKAGLRTSRWKFIETLDKSNQELYDLLNDPAEMSNLVEDTTLSEVRQSLESQLHQQISQNLKCFKKQSPQAIGQYDQQTRQELKALGYID